MSLNLVSPGVKVREVDLTIGRIDGANEQVGAIAGPFEKGPIDVPILIENEQDLLATFGKPLSTDGQYGYWLSASNFLSYGGVLRVLRSDEEAGMCLNNANVGSTTTSGVTGVKIKSYQNYVDDYQTVANESLSFKFAAKNPGSWGNGLKVCTIDAFADQIITVSGIATTTTELPKVGMGITQQINDRVNVGNGSTSLYDGYMRGIITGVNSGLSTGEYTATISVKITDRVSSAGVSSALTYGELGFREATSKSVPTTTTVGIASGSTDEVNDIIISGISTVNLGGDADKDIALGDVVEVVEGDDITIGAGATVIGIGATTITVDRAITGIGSTGYRFTRPNDPVTTNVNKLYIHSGVGTAATTFTSSANKDWYNEQTLGLTNSTVYWKSIAEKPGTSQYASERSGKNDEIHVVVVDESGSISGIAGNVLEKFTYLSKAKDGKISPSESTWYKDKIAQNSEYIYVGYTTTGAASGLTAGVGTNKFTSSGVGNVGSDAQGVTFSVMGATTDTLGEGKNYTAADGYDVTLGDVINSYNVLKNPAEYDVNFLINGPSGGANMFDSQAKAKAVIAIAELRKDCIACISPHKDDIVKQPNSDKQTDAIVNFYSNLQSSSYAVFDSGYKYQYDRWNNEYRWMPTNADVAGLMAKTSINSFSWFSPAGTSRGSLNGAVKLAYNPTQAQRDILYPKRVNPIVAMPGSGIILFGDRTALATASAFDRINVRRLFLTIEDTIGRAAKDQLFEFNDVITRSNFLNVVEPYLRDVKAKRGITDYVVICDETNNTPDVIDSNQFRADIFVKPARSINFIGLTFVATRTGISFEEVVGNV